MWQSAQSIRQLELRYPRLRPEGPGRYFDRMHGAVGAIKVGLLRDEGIPIIVATCSGGEGFIYRAGKTFKKRLNDIHVDLIQQL